MKGKSAKKNNQFIFESFWTRFGTLLRSTALSGQGLHHPFIFFWLIQRPPPISRKCQYSAVKYSSSAASQQKHEMGFFCQFSTELGPTRRWCHFFIRLPPFSRLITKQFHLKMDCFEPIENDGFFFQIPTQVQTCLMHGFEASYLFGTRVRSRVCSEENRIPSRHLV